MNATNWVTVCQQDDLVDNSGVCALIEGKQVALFKLRSANDEKVYALSNWDPLGKANVLYRGLIGSMQNTPIVISPLHKQRYCMLTGQCIDNDEAKLDVYPVRVKDQCVQLGL